MTNLPKASSETFKKDDRSSTTTYPLGTQPDGSSIEMEIHSSHSKDRKAYSTTIFRIAVSDRNGFQVKSFDLFGDSLALRSERTSRYSAAALQSFHAESVEMVHRMLQIDESDKLTRLCEPVGQAVSV